MRAGLLRICYWAIDSTTGERAELLAVASQGPDGRFDGVFSTDVRAIDAVLEMQAGDQWRPVRTRRVAPNTPGLLPTSDEI